MQCNESLLTIFKSLLVKDENGCPAVSEDRVSGSFDPLPCDPSLALQDLLARIITNAGGCNRIRTVAVNCSGAITPYSGCGLGSSTEELIRKMIVKDGTTYALLIHETGFVNNGCDGYITCDNMNEGMEQTFRKMIAVCDDTKLALLVAPGVIADVCDPYFDCNSDPSFEGALRRALVTNIDSVPILRTAS